MTKKPTVTTLASGFNSTETLNTNFEALRDGFDNTLSLDGSTPNAMEADLDLNGNNIIGATGLLINGTDYLADVTTAKTAALAAQAAAETAETNAETAKTGAETARDSALAALDSFDDRYLGVKTSDPTVDNDGDALLVGALYFNSNTDKLYIYNGSSWQITTSGAASGDLISTNNLSDLTSAATARTNLGLGTAATTASTDYATSAQGALADTATQPSDLGTAAAADTGDFATAAQGVLADTAVQPNDDPNRIFQIPSGYSNTTSNEVGPTIYHKSTNVVQIATGNDGIYSYDNTELSSSVTRLTSGSYRIKIMKWL